MDQVQKDNWAHIFDSLEDMILVVDEDDKIIEANESCEEYLDMDIEDIKGSTCDDIFDIDQSGVNQECFLKGGDPDGENKFYLSKKDTFLYVRSFPITDDELGWTIYQIREMTEKKDMKGELEQYSEQLNKYKNETQKMIQSEKMASLSRLVSGIAHEINNPLGYMKSSIGFIMDDIRELKERYDEEEYTEFLDDIEKNLEMNVEGINKITDITETLRKFVSADIEGESKTDLNENLDSTLTLLENEFKENIELKKDLGDLPDVRCSPGELNQVFMNVIYNALQSMEEGTIEITTWSEDKEIYIKIKDDGEGISEDVRNKIFDPFYTTKNESTGLGLSVSYRIVKEHGGDIQVESKEGVGTEVTISLPKEE